MSTTEDQPAAPDIYVSATFKLGDTYVWTDGGGVTHGAARIGGPGTDIVFHNPQQVRDLIAYLATLAGEMDAEIRRQQPPPEVTRDAAGEVWPSDDRPLPEPEGYPCSACGATAPPKRAGRCHNRVECDKRVAARDADAAKAALR